MSQSEMEKRALAREDEWYNLTTQQLRRLKKYYEATATELIKEIEALYGRYGRENKLPPSEARRLIRGKEFREWRMSLEEYVKSAQADEKLLLELNTLAMRSRINRLDVLYSKTLMELGDLSERLKDFSDAFFYRSFVEHYYGTLYDIGQEVGLKTPPVELDRAKVAAVLQTNWSGKLYDERIRAQRRRYSAAIKEIVLRAVHKGESIEKLSRRLSEKMQSDYKSAELLVRTEVNYFQNRAAAEALRDADFTHYQFVATLDRRTCARCGNKDGEVYPLSEMNQGENAPPLHPRCRCTIIASFGEKLSGTRISEGRKKIPAEMSYKEWRAGIEKNYPKSDSSGSELVPRSLKEAKAVADKFNPVVGKYFVRKSKWNGQTVISPRQSNCKMPNCAIGILLKDCPDEAILHELVHSYSTSYYPNKTYQENRAMEEASVQYLTQEIAKREGIKLSGSDYDFWTDALREINKTLGLYESDLKFARRLLRVPMTRREEWLSGKVQKAMAGKTFEEINAVTEQLNKLTWEAFENELRRIGAANK